MDVFGDEDSDEHAARTTPGRTRPTVVYIAGFGRSGSTLLERVLGETEGFVNVGELVDLFRWVAPQNERCGCGAAFADCPFWSEVGARAFGGWDHGLLAHVSSLQRLVARQRRLPQLLAQPHGRRFASRLHAYQHLYRTLYEAILEVSGARSVVDASKWPAQALSLSLAPDMDVRVLHLVRDARGVAFSWAKSGVARPHASAGRTTMAALPVARTAGRWSACQAEVEVVARRAHRYHRLRYEDFVSEPALTVRASMEGLGLGVGADGLRHLSDGSAALGPSHGISGNPSRFRIGEQRLSLDEEWRRAMTNRDRRTATAVSLPLLARYGYLGQEPPAG